MRCTANRIVLVSCGAVLVASTYVAVAPADPPPGNGTATFTFPSSADELEKQLPEAAKRERVESEKLQEKALEWLKTNNAEKSAESELATGMVEPLKKITEGGHNFSILMGSSLTADGKPYMLSGWLGEFFPFALSERQAASINMTETRFRYFAIKRSGRRFADPILKLSDLKIADADAIDGGRPIKGTVKIGSTGFYIGATFVYMRIEMQGSTRLISRNCKLDNFKYDGFSEKTVEFEFDPINEAGDTEKPVQGALPTFFSVIELSTDLDREKTALFSNTLGQIIEVD